MAANPYETLGVDPKTEQDKIKSAYRKLAKQFHPDLNPGNSKAESRFKDIASAYEVIGTPEKRAKFDRGEVEAEAAKKSKGRRPFYSETQCRGSRYANRFEGMDEEILNSIFEQMNQDKELRYQQAPNDQLYQLDVDFKDSILGIEREIAFPDGKKFVVKIPAGVDSGTKLRFASKGHQGADIYVQMNVIPSSTFKRVGKDLEIEIPISLGDAILGAEIKIPTIDGLVMVTIPHNVKSDQRLRIRGKGLVENDNKSRGDQIAILKIEMPETTDEEFRSAVADWRKRQVKEIP